MDHNTPGFPVLHYVLEFAQTHVCWVSDAIQSSHPLLPPLLLPSVFPSIRVFSNELALPIRWPKVLELQLQHQSFQWRFSVDFLAVQGTLKSLLQHHNLKASLRCLRFLQDSCPTIEGPFWVLGKKSYPRPEIPLWPLAESECQLWGGGEQRVPHWGGFWLHGSSLDSVIRALVMLVIIDLEVPY